MSNNNDWHWLTRDANDLPDTGSTVIAYWATKCASGVTTFVYDKFSDESVGFGFKDTFDNVPISDSCVVKAWQYLPSILTEDSLDDVSLTLNQRLDKNDNVVTDIMHRLSVVENVVLCVAKVFTSFDKAL